MGRCANPSNFEVHLNGVHPFHCNLQPSQKRIRSIVLQNGRENNTVVEMSIRGQGWCY